MAEVTSWQAGQVISQEEPWQYTLSMEAASQHCYYCLVQLDVSSNPKPKSKNIAAQAPMRSNCCSICRHVKYCSLECQKNDWKEAHKVICPALKRIQVKGIKPDEHMLLTLKVLTKFAHSPAKVAPLLQLTSSRLPFVLKDLKRGGDLIAERKVLLDLLQLTPEQRDVVGSEDIANILARVKCFAIPIMGTHLNKVGMGIYLKASPIEHSCAPNACLTFVGKRVRVMAFEKVENIDQVRVNYVDKLHPVEWRQRLLKSEFHVDCRCVLCADPAKDAERFSLTCVNKKCDAEIPSDCRANMPCGKCGAKPTTNRQLEFADIHQDSCDLMSTLLAPGVENRTKAASDFARLHEKMVHVLHPKNPLWPSFIVRQTYLKKSNDSAEFAEAYRLYKAFLPPLDPRIGFCAFRSIKPSASNMLETLIRLEEASRILNTMLGTEHELARTTSECYRQCGIAFGGPGCVGMVLVPMKLDQSELRIAEAKEAMVKLLVDPE